VQQLKENLQVLQHNDAGKYNAMMHKIHHKLQGLNAQHFYDELQRKTE
jgi:hypothetical protein